MKKSILLVFLLGVIAIVSCKKDKEEENQFHGTWEFKSNDSAIADTSFVLNINDEGAFNYSLSYNGTSGDILGNVSENGQVSGDITAFGFNLGSLSGQLHTSGHGNGYYYIMSDTLAWEAVRL